MTGQPYAHGTTVTVEKSKSEIEQTVRRYGATKFISGYDEHRAFVLFEAHDRMVKFLVDVPAPADERFRLTARRESRSPEQRQAAAAAEERRLWRCLLLSIKSKLEVIASGIATFEQEFLAHVVLPDGSTMGQWAGPQIELAYETQQMPSLQLALGSGAS